MRFHRDVGWLVVAMLVGLVARPVEAGAPAAGFVETTVVAGLSVPTAIAFLPDGRLLVTQQSGELRLVANGVATTIATLPVCFPEFDPSFETETGLLGIAVHPAFPTDRSIYLYRTRTIVAEPCTESNIFSGTAKNEVVRVTLAADDTVDLGSLEALLTGIGAATGNHNGGGLRIGPDQKLYVSVGDNGVLDPSGPPGSSSNPYAQDLAFLEGKILRLELDGSPAAGNPFVGQGGVREEVFALGFRNPFRFGFDPVTSALWAADVGEDTIEEIDRVTAGGNYGWPRCEGTLPNGCALPGDVAPAFSYPHDGAGALGKSVTGGAFPRTGALAAYADRYVFGDFSVDPSGALYSIALRPDRMAVDGAAAPVVTSAGGPVDIVIGPDGALYYAAYLDGAVRRVAAEGSPPPGGCKTIAECQAGLDATLPDPTAAADAKSRKVAKRLAKRDRKSDGKLAKAAAATGTKQARKYAQARTALGKLVTLARAADGKGRLGVALAPIEAAVSALLAVIPGG